MYSECGAVGTWVVGEGEGRMLVQVQAGLYLTYCIVHVMHVEQIVRIYAGIFLTGIKSQKQVNVINIYCTLHV